MAPLQDSMEHRANSLVAIRLNISVSRPRHYSLSSHPKADHLYVLVVSARVGMKDTIQRDGSLEDMAEVIVDLSGRFWREREGRVSAVRAKRAPSGQVLRMEQ